MLKNLMEIETIKELDEYCRFKNFSVKFSNRDRQTRIKGFHGFDYRGCN